MGGSQWLGSGGCIQPGIVWEHLPSFSFFFKILSTRISPQRGGMASHPQTRVDSFRYIVKRDEIENFVKCRGCDSGANEKRPTGN